MYTATYLEDRVILQAQEHYDIEIYTFGSLLNRFACFLANGTWQNTIHGYDRPETARQIITQGFNSAKLSPFPCRLKQGRYTFNHTEHQIKKHTSGTHALHGILYDADFTLSRIGTNAKAAWTELTHQYDGDIQGYPFPYRISNAYRLDKNGLHISTIIENIGNTAMPIADGWHPYFTLGNRVDDWTLFINSHRRLIFDGELLPTGRETEDTRFLTPTLLKGIELDNSFILNPTHNQPVCTLQYGTIALHISAEEHYPILQVYIPPKRDSIALENLSAAPDCFNNGIGLTVLPPNATHTFRTRYHIDIG